MPLSDDIDDSDQYTQPQPTYASGRAGLTGKLEPYNRPGKTSLFRMYTYFLQPKQDNSDVFWNKVIDPIWLENSIEPDAAAMRSAHDNPSLPWRLLYRITHSERFLPPLSIDTTITPCITPLLAIPVVNLASDFLFTTESSQSNQNPANDIESNVVLVAPTNLEIVNNVIQASSLDILNLINSILGLNTVPMTGHAPIGSTRVIDIVDPVGALVYSIYTDPNGLKINVGANPNIIVYQDVNSNPIQYFDGKTYHSLQKDYIASPDGTTMFYIQPPQSSSNDSDEWRYYLVSGFSADMSSESNITKLLPFRTSTAYKGFKVAYTSDNTQKLETKGTDVTTATQAPVVGYVIVKGRLEWPNLNSKFETFADVSVYKNLSIFDMFPIGDGTILNFALNARYPKASFIRYEDIKSVFARNIISYFNSAQLLLLAK